MFNPGKSQQLTYGDIPSAWILEHYLGVSASGQSIRMKTPFKAESRHADPLVIFLDKKSRQYRFKCWSTGRAGRLVDLLMHLWHLDFPRAASRIEGDYQQFLASGYSPAQLVQLSLQKWQVVAHQTRGWQAQDARFWGSFNISSYLLEQELVRPLAHYQMLLFVDGEETSEAFFVEGPQLYGYFRPDGVLYKIYQPGNTHQKYIKVENYLQGEHSLWGFPHLCICSGMKDLLALKSLHLRVDFVAPDSENVLLRPEKIWELQKKHNYHSICTLLDNDQTGLESMRKYRDRDGIPPAYLKLEVDAAKAIQVHGPNTVTQLVVPSFHRVTSTELQRDCIYISHGTSRAGSDPYPGEPGSASDPRNSV